MRRLLSQDFLYFESSGIVNVVVFAVYSSKCAIYFEMCRQAWTTTLDGEHFGWRSTNTVICMLAKNSYVQGFLSVVSLRYEQPNDRLGD